MWLQGLIRGCPEDFSGGMAEDFVNRSAREFRVLVVDVTVFLITIQQRDARRHGLKNEPKSRVGQGQLGGSPDHSLLGIKI
jgi:hypothetical protein